MAENEQIHPSATPWPINLLGKSLYKQRWSIVSG
jgi:hypothetical protein